MTSGYDKRSRFTTRRRFRTVQRNPAANRMIGSLATVKETVTSFRDDVIEAKRVPTDTFDPYLKGLTRSPGGIADYFDPGRRLLNSMEESGLLTEKDRNLGHSRGFIPDNGHPFLKETHQVKTSASRAGYRIQGFSDTPTNYVDTDLVAVQSVTLTATGKAAAPFPVQGGTSTTGIARFYEELSFADVVDDLDDFGTLAIARCAPGVPEVSMAAILGELVQDVPAFPGVALLKSLRGSSLGDEYLNLVFGLVPTHSDAKNLAKVLRSYSMRLHQLRRDAGRPVRRSFGIPDYQKADILSSASGQIHSGPDRTVVAAGGYGGFGFDMKLYDGASSSIGNITNSYYANTSLFMRETRKTWFKGSFTYVLPELPGFNKRLESYMVETDRLLGLTIDPSVAWQLSPWSWLIDWFIDIGDQMEALTVNFDDNLVLNYGYAMRTIERSIVAKVEYLDTALAHKASGLRFVDTSLTSTQKRRIRANPYGFVLQTDGDFWSSYRLAVLGALGFQRR